MLYEDVKRRSSNPQNLFLRLPPSLFAPKLPSQNNYIHVCTTSIFFGIVLHCIPIVGSELVEIFEKEYENVFMNSILKMSFFYMTIRRMKQNPGPVLKILILSFKCAQLWALNQIVFQVISFKTKIELSSESCKFEYSM